MVKLEPIPPCLLSGIRTISLHGQLHNFHDAWLSIASQANCDTGGEVLSWIEDGVVPSKEKTLAVTCLLTRFSTTIYHVDRFPPIFLVLF